MPRALPELHFEEIRATLRSVHLFYSIFQHERCHVSLPWHILQWSSPFPLRLSTPKSCDHGHKSPCKVQVTFPCMKAGVSGTFAQPLHLSSVHLSFTRKYHLRSQIISTLVHTMMNYCWNHSYSNQLCHRMSFHKTIHRIFLSF